MKVATEIVLRLYLTIGFIALLGLLALAVTSTDAMVRRLGSGRWQRLHQLVYGIALLALIHFFQQTKADIWVPTFVAGLFVWLMGYRLMMRWRRGVPSALALLALAVIASALVFAGEAIGIALYYNVSPLLVLQSIFEFDLDMIRPGWLVLGAGLCVVILQVVQSWRQKPPRPAAKAVPNLHRHARCRPRKWLEPQRLREHRPQAVILGQTDAIHHRQPVDRSANVTRRRRGYGMVPRAATSGRRR